MEQEATLAKQKGKPVYLLAGFGGHTRKLFDEWSKQGKLESQLHNCLTEDDNLKLGRTRVIDEVIELVLKGLEKLASSRPSTRP